MEPQSSDLNVNPESIMVVPLSKVVGGKETRRKVVGSDSSPVYDTNGLSGTRHTTEANVVTIIHNVEERKKAEALVAEALHAIRKASSYVGPLKGYLTTKTKISDMWKDLDEVKERAASFNFNATTCHVVIQALPLDISVAIGPEAARAIADFIREELEQYRQALLSGDQIKSRAQRLRSKNLHTLAVGVQSQCISFALEAGDSAFEALNAALKRNESPESAGRTLDLAMIQSAIDMFSYEGQKPTVEGAVNTNAQYDAQ